MIQPAQGVEEDFKRSCLSICLSPATSTDLTMCNDISRCSSYDGYTWHYDKSHCAAFCHNAACCQGRLLLS